MVYSPHMDKDTKDILETVNFIKDHMATKDDIDDMKSILADHTRDLAIIKSGVTTNLDKRLQLEVHVTAIEKHLGLDKKIPA